MYNYIKIMFNELISKLSEIITPCSRLLQPVAARMRLININPQLLVDPVLVPYLGTDSSLLLSHIQGAPGGMCQTSGECSLC